MCGTCRTMRQKEGGEAILRVCAIKIIKISHIIEKNVNNMKSNYLLGLHFFEKSLKIIVACKYKHWKLKNQMYSASKG